MIPYREASFELQNKNSFVLILKIVHAFTLHGQSISRGSAHKL